ncbi:MAG: hypothetical protein ABF868_10145 [Sporolactobacillus sp.]
MNRICDHAEGMHIIGKWHRRRYLLTRKIGSGAQGTVYMAMDGGKKMAVKLAKDRASLTAEVNVLKQFTRVTSPPLGPSVYDFDDWISPEGIISFCTMEYLNGISAADALLRRSFDWTVIFMIQLLRQLGELHHYGYIFADLKPENLIVMPVDHQVRCVDFGGATRIGRSVREYTEFYDRGYWGMGSRKADVGYDLFACAMILIFAAKRGRMSKTAASKQQLMETVKNQPSLRPYRQALISALTGRYAYAEEMRQALLKSMLLQSSHSQTLSSTSHHMPAPVARPGTGGWGAAWAAALIMLVVYTFAVLVNLL